MATLTLARGQNTGLPQTDLVTVSVSQTGLDLLAFQLTTGSRVRDDHDFVYYNQPSSPEGAVRLADGGEIEIRLHAVPEDVERIAVAVASDRPLGASTLTAQIRAADVVIDAPADGLTTEHAAVLVEIYRRNGSWKARSESAGWDAGFPALVRSLGVTVDDDPDISPAEQPGTPDRDPMIRTVHGEDRLSLEKRQVLDLRKKAVHRVLLTKGVAGRDARVIMVIDKTLSMSALYRRRTVHRVVERMIPVATQLDSDGNLETYLYARRFAKLPDVTVANAELWIDTFVHLRGRHGAPLCPDIDYDEHIGGANEELPIMRAILDDLQGDQPVLVLFFTDGGFHSRVAAIRALIAEAAARPVFWQFIGLGDNNFGTLTSLDTMTGRVVDNAGFFQVEDIDERSDDQLYADVLGEFGEWMTAAGELGIVARS
ncbi:MULTISPECIES: VWA domain-containing protein [unclassified Gordonia (in: high G+C Gram-positive bacteria)]|uniref:VWA domain-containing protein n=1 Tax=unclassified Gordonia (in: high G+C Gram-positive bacteria) TaxID=2657482 RepID=UPI00071C2D85|nr:MULTISPECIES: VWA domain-containing protein [unclassified Gordonia (in: high G+C Gram-positive bacteria)]SCB84022.1 Stress response protein SCP2 [Gordonia sp. v-85]